MKKWMALLLAVSMVCALALTGCGKEEPEYEMPEPPTREEVEENAEEILDDLIEEVEGALEESEEAPEEASEDRDFSLGVVEDGEYRNDYLGVTFPIPEDWVVMTAEELQDMGELVRSELEGPISEEVLEQYPSFLDFQTGDAEGMMSINVACTAIGAQERLTYRMMDDEDVIDVLLTQEDTLRASYEQMGMTDVVMEKTDVEYCGEEHCALLTYAVMNDVPFYTLQLMEYALGGYGVTITANSIGEDVTAELLAGFTAMD